MTGTSGICLLTSDFKPLRTGKIPRGVCVSLKRGESGELRSLGSLLHIDTHLREVDRKRCDARIGRRERGDGLFRGLALHGRLQRCDGLVLRLQAPQR